MKNIVWFAHVAFALAVVPGTLSQAQTTGKQNAAINITECGTISQAGSYVLANNLTASGGNCLTVSADSVTIDLAGFVITGPGPAGIFGSSNNVVVRNGTVTGFENGILLGSALQGSRVEGVRAINNQIGIRLVGAASAVVKGCTAESNSSIGISTGERALVSDNTVYQNGEDGISAGAGSMVKDNRVESNGGQGITIRPGEGDAASDGSGALVSGNVVRMNGKTGISTGAGSTVSGNIAQRNGPRESPTGIYVGPGSTVSNNTAEGNQIMALCTGSAGFLFHNISTPFPQGLFYLVAPGRCTALQNVGKVVLSDLP